MDLEELVAGLVRPTGVRSRRGSWYGNDDRLVAITAHGRGDQATGLLAQGLQHLAGRDLHLVVPRPAVDVLRARVAFLDVTVHVHPTRRTGFGDPEPPMTRTEATAFYRRLGGVTPSPRWDATGWPGWLVELVDWLESRRVERVRTTEAHAWHYRGRQVLHVRQAATDGAYCLTIGAPTTDGEQTAPRRLRIAATDEPTPVEIEQMKYTVDMAIERRRTGADAGQRERLLQAAIGTDPALLGLTHLHREVPAWRPGQQPRCQRGSIDFLGRDVTRTGHVIEIKRGPDPQLGIQVLDYWAWTDAHRNDLAALLDTDAHQPFELDLVLGRTTRPLLHPAAAATLPKLASDIAWRCHLVTHWDTIAHPGQLLTPTTEALRPRHLPA